MFLYLLFQVLSVIVYKPRNDMTIMSNTIVHCPTTRVSIVHSQDGHINKHNRSSIQSVDYLEQWVGSTKGH